MSFASHTEGTRRLVADVEALRDLAGRIRDSDPHCAAVAARAAEVVTSEAAERIRRSLADTCADTAHAIGGLDRGGELLEDLDGRARRLLDAAQTQIDLIRRLR